jgi:uncharacterized protein YbbC (DUF1343 family)
MWAGAGKTTAHRAERQRGRNPSPRSRTAAAVLLCGYAAGCTAAGRPDPDGSGRVATGVDVLVRDGAAVLEGRRLGLITNHTGIDRSGRSTIELLHEDPRFDLIALFSPEHAITGRVEAGVEVASDRHPDTGLPIHSLYGETRRPTAEMLAGVDALLFDIQDIGTRYYTYVWTMAHALEAAAEHDIDFIVLDRPNPIGGELVQGNVLESEFRTFVGLYPVATRHGLTAGELARLLNEEFGIGARLHVVQLQGWRRGMWFDQTGLPWVAPSPNMPNLESATHYPGTCLFEGTNLSVGRGTPAAFQQVGAPWLDADALVRRLETYSLPGIRFEATTFSPENPGDGRYPGTAVNGVRLVATDRSAYDPVLAGIALLVEIRALHADSLRFVESHFDRLAGTDRIRHMLLGGAPLERITAGWPQQVELFDRLRQRHLLYP